MGTRLDLRDDQISAAIDLGYRLVGSYALTVAEEIRWLATAARGGTDAQLLPGRVDPFFAPFLGYTTEDRYFACRCFRDHPWRSRSSWQVDAGKCQNATTDQVAPASEVMYMVPMLTVVAPLPVWYRPTGA